MLKFDYIANGKLPRIKVKSKIEFEKLFVQGIKVPIKIRFLEGPAFRMFHWTLDDGANLKKYCETDCELCKEYKNEFINANIRPNMRLKPQIEYISLIADLNRTMKIMYFPKQLAEQLLQFGEIEEDGVIKIEKFKEWNNAGFQVTSYKITATEQHMRRFKGSDKLFDSIVKQEGYKYT